MKWISIGAAVMAAAVAAGAFGAHGLEARLDDEAMGRWLIGARYHAYHGLGLVAVGLVDQFAPSKGTRVAGWAMCIGLIFFSGSLYLMALTGMTWLGAITPIGGTAWIVGWIALAMATRGRSVSS